jgi:hypothetical protein
MKSLRGAALWRRDVAISRFIRHFFSKINDVPKGANQMAKNKRPAVRVTSTQSRTEFNPDYTYVKKDLARIGALAGFFIVVLVVLSFFLK